MRLRVVSWNVRYFGHGTKGLVSTPAGIRRAARALAALEAVPHLVALQEVEHRSLRSRLAVPEGRSQLEVLLAELEAAFAARRKRMPWVAYYFPAHVHRLRGVALQSMGLAVLVDARWLTVANHNAGAPHPITHFHLRILRSRKQCRIAAHLELRLRDGRPLHLFNTHLSLPTPFSRNFWVRRERLGYGTNQLAEAQTLAAFVRRTAHGEPFVVAGDFNATPGSPVYELLTGPGGFVGAQEALGLADPARPRAFPSAGFLRLRMHLDHLFVGGGVRPIDFDGTLPFGDAKSPFAGASDHTPIVARLEVPR
jgi:endonuclease/exonuclease/phosphatase family metal-dependent hydrolase